MEIINKSLKIIGFTLLPWQSAAPMNRMVGPVHYAGYELIRGNKWDRIYFDRIYQADIVMIQHNFTRYDEAFNQILDRAREEDKPVLIDVDEFCPSLPLSHPERGDHYYTDRQFPYLRAIVESDIVTTSSAALCSYLEPLNPNTKFIPSYLHDQIWKTNHKKKSSDNYPIILGYLGNHSYTSDLDSISPALRRILTRYSSKILLRLWGVKPPSDLIDFPNLEWKSTKLHDYSAYAKELAQSGIDIYILPLSDHPQNSFVSSRMYLEQSSLSVPGIYSEVDPFITFINHGENGYLATDINEWEHYLSELIESSDTRRQVGRKAQLTVESHWLLSKNSETWKMVFNDAIHQMREDQKTRDKDRVHYFIDAARQVQNWQRTLETDLLEKKWEIQALNVMAKRKERELGDEILNLQKKLEVLQQQKKEEAIETEKPVRSKLPSHKWLRGKSPHWLPNLLRTLRLYDRSLSQETSIETTSETISPLETTDESAQIPLIPPSSYDLVIFANGWPDQIEKRLSRLATYYVEKGHRVFYVIPSSQGIQKDNVHLLQEGVYGVQVDFHHPANNLDDNVNTKAIRNIHKEFSRLRSSYQISTAVCLVITQLWSPVVFNLRNIFGWKIVFDYSSNQQHLLNYSQSPIPVDTLTYRSDLLLLTTKKSNRENSLINPNILRVPETLDTAVLEKIYNKILALFPIASIIIVTYNNLDYTRLCLESIQEKTKYPNYEIIIIDNASRDGTPEFLTAYESSSKNVRLILNDENLGFARANNQGVAASNGEYIVFLNNDTVVTHGWLSRLANYLNDPQIGILGPVTNFAGNESKIAVDYGHIIDLDDFALRYTTLHEGETREIRMLALFCVIMRRSLFDTIGPLDERFTLGMFEDDDYALRIRQLGFKIICAEDVYIHHWGSSSFSKLDKDRFQQLQIENRRKFEQKWGTVWEPHRWRIENN